jgi:hypothetical protein
MRFSRRRNHGPIVGLALYGAALVAIPAFVALNEISRMATEKARKEADDEAARARRYTGKITIPDGAHCRNLAFDNITGALREGTPSPCREETSDVNSTQGRIDAIRSAFVKR